MEAAQEEGDLYLIINQMASKLKEKMELSTNKSSSQSQTAR